MKFILGKKVKMTQIWSGDKQIPVTVLQAGPITVTQVRATEKDGYEAVQVGFDKSDKKANKPLAGHLKDLGNFKTLKEFRVEGSDLKVGDVIDVAQFAEGDVIKVSGLSKGRGFQGVVKRHGFGGGPKTHGQKNRHRAPGSIGSTATQRVVPGRKMAGHMGQERFSIKNLKVAAIDRENNLLMIHGPVPGMRGTLIEVRG